MTGLELWLKGRGRRGNGVGEIPDEENELPALFVGEFFAVGRHGFVACGDDVEEFAVGNFLEMRGVGEIRRTRIVHFSLWAISLPCFAMAFGTFVQKDRTDLLCSAFWIERKRVFHLLRFERNCPETAHKGGVGEVGGQSKKDDEEYGSGASGRGF